MTDPMSVAAAKVPNAPAGQQPHAHAPRPRGVDGAGAWNGDANGASGPKKTQDWALNHALRDAPAKAQAQYRPDGRRADDAPRKESKEEDGRQEKMVAEAVGVLKGYLGSLPSEMKFDYDEEAGRQVFKVINPVTQEVVRQFPPDEFLDMVKRLKELAKNADDNGMLFDDSY